MQDMRILQRARTRCLGSSTCDSSSAAFANFSFFLLKGGEHTWGGCVSCALFGADIYSYNSTADYTQWTNGQFHARQHDPAFTILTRSFLEQRTWAIDCALQALPPAHPIRDEYRQERETVQPLPPPNASEWVAVPRSDWGRLFKMEGVLLSFDWTGALNRLSVTVGSTALELVSKNHTLGAYHYQSYTHDDFVAFFNEYSNVWLHVISCALTATLH